MFARYGAAAVFSARFIFGLRIFAGPLAGVLRMRWRAFAVFNFLGAALWVILHRQRPDIYSASIGALSRAPCSASISPF
jgi:hypothetical protein